MHIYGEPELKVEALTCSTWKQAHAYMAIDGIFVCACFKVAYYAGVVFIKTDRSIRWHLYIYLLAWTRSFLCGLWRFLSQRSRSPLNIIDGLDRQWMESRPNLWAHSNRDTTSLRSLYGSCVVFPCQCRGGVLRSVYCAWEYSTGEASPLMLSPWASWSGMNTW